MKKKDKVKAAGPAIIYCSKCKDPILPKDERDQIGKKVVCGQCYLDREEKQEGNKQ